MSRPIPVIRRFDSVGAMLAEIQGLRRVTYPEDRDGERLDRFYGGATPEQAMDLATRGWPALTGKLARLTERLADRVVLGHGQGEAVDLVTDVTGAAFDVGAVLAGVPECWTSRQSVECHTVARILVNGSVSSGVSREAIEQRGVAIAALVSVLQARGVPVDLRLRWVAVGREGDYTITRAEGARHLVNDTSVRLVQDGTPLDIDRLLFWLAHPAAARHMSRQIANQVQGDHHPDQVVGDQDRWSHRTTPCADAGRDDPDVDLFLGGQHAKQVERWQDGGEAWILAEIERLTQRS